MKIIKEFLIRSFLLLRRIAASAVISILAFFKGLFIRSGLLLLGTAVPFILIFCCELLLSLIFYFASIFDNTAVQAYFTNIWTQNFIQIDPACSRYDPQLTYRLRPGTCTFENLEFSTTYHINSMGLRDDEQSLKNPAAVFLGDSYTMGWGVEQNDTFPQLIESWLGEPVLNAGISSYGTVREMLLMLRLPVSDASTLIIQYCDNDGSENKSFEPSLGNLNIMTADEYNFYIQRTLIRRNFFFPRHLETLWYNYFVAPPEDEFILYDDRAEHFLEILSAFEHELLQFETIIVTNLCGPRSEDFLKALEKKLSLAEYSLWKNRLILLPLRELAVKYGFRFDIHVKPEGHVKIAENIYHVMQHPLNFPRGEVLKECPAEDSF